MNPSNALSAVEASSRASVPDVVAPPRSAWGKWASRAFILAVVVGLWIPRLSGPIDLRYDAGVYFLLGTSLAQGHGYRLSNEPGDLEAVQYPPGLPALVAAHAKLFGTTDPVELGRWLRRTYFLLFIAFGLSVLALARTQLGLLWATAATTACLLQLNTYLMSDMLFAELPFALVSVGFVYALLRPWKRLRDRETVGFLLASLGFSIRSAGLALLAAWVADAVIRRQWRLVVLRAVLSLAPFALWQGYVSRVHASPAYQHPAYAYQRAPYQFYNVTYAENIALIDPFQPELGKIDGRTLLARFAANLAVIPNSVGEAVSTTFGFWRWALTSLEDATLDSRPLPVGLVRIPMLALAAAACLGLIILAAQRKWIFPIYVAASLALVCATPWPGQFSRYLTPLCAFLVIAAFVGASWLQTSWSARRGKRNRRVARCSLGFLALLAFSAQIFTGVQVFIRRQTDPRMPSLNRPEQHHLFYHDRTWTAWEEAVKWIGGHAGPDDVVATVAPHLCYLWIGRKTIFPPMEADAARARQLLEAVPVAYVIVDELEFLDIGRRYAEPAVAALGSGWAVVYSSGKTRVYSRAAYTGGVTR